MIDKQECYKKYWESHPEEDEIWGKTEPFLVGYKYGIHSQEYIESLKPFSPDNPEILFAMFQHHVVCKRISEGVKCLERLKELYPDYNDWWNSYIESVQVDMKDEIMNCTNTKKVQNFMEFVNNEGRSW